MLSNVYGPHNQHDCRLFFSELSTSRSKYTLPWDLIGDFNVTRFSSEWKGAVSSLKPSSIFNNFINSQALTEIGLFNKKFTWSNFREEPSLATLDCCFVSIDWQHRFPLVNLRNMVRPTSDHIPLLLHIESDLQGKSSGNKPFRFKNL